MGNFGVRYAGLLGIVMTLFLTFVACGSQLYQVSLHGDSGSRTAAKEAEQGKTGTLMATGPEGSADPASPNYGLHATGGWQSLPIHYRTDPTLTPAQVGQLQAAMHTWELATGRTLFAYDGVQQGISGDSFKDLYSSLDDQVDGQYLDDHWGKTGKPTVVLATTIWDNDANDVNKILTADIRYNNQNYVFGDALVAKAQRGREVVDLQTVATHEFGHFLGLVHVDPNVDSHSIMVASLYIGEGLTARGVSSGDIKRIQKIYGCKGSACDIEATQKKIQQLLRVDPTDDATVAASKTTSTVKEIAK